MIYKLTTSVHKWHLTLVCSRTSSSCIPKYKHTMLAISMLNYNFSLVEGKRRRKTNAGQSNVNFSPLTLPCSTIPLAHGGVYCLPCNGRLLFIYTILISIYYVGAWGIIGSCSLLSFFFSSTRYDGYLVDGLHCYFLVVMWGYVGLKEFYAYCVNGSIYFCGDNYEGSNIPTLCSYCVC